MTAKYTGLAIALLSITLCTEARTTAAFTEKTANAVVAIETFDANGRRVSHGSGFIAAPLKIDADDLSSLALSEGSIRIGDPVVAADAPYDLRHTFTTGATAAPGSSGEPLLGEAGNVLGANTSVDGPFPFAVPAHYVRTTAGTGGGPKSLKEVRDEKVEALTRELTGRVQSNQHYYTYKDKLGVSIRFPVNYITSREEWVDDEQTRHVVLFAAARDAMPESSQAWLRDGIRIHFKLPRKGHEWKRSYLDEQTETSLKALASSYKEFRVLEETKKTKLGEFDAYGFSVVGENPDHLKEPEIGAGFVVARPDFIAVAEVTAPASKEKTYLELRIATLTLQAN
jgi:hypothetical protein